MDDWIDSDDDDDVGSDENGSDDGRESKKKKSKTFCVLLKRLFARNFNFSIILSKRQLRKNQQ